MCKKRILGIFIICITIALITGCGYTKEEKEKIALYEKVAKENAIEYIKSKYGFTPKVLKAECETSRPSEPFLPHPPTGEVYVKLSYKNQSFWVLTTGTENTTTFGYDNYQETDISTGIWNEMEKMLGCDILRLVVNYGLSDYNNYKEADKYHGLVNDYYDGKNLAKVLGNAKYNSLEVYYALDKDSNIETQTVINAFGSNTECLFVNYLIDEIPKLDSDFSRNNLLNNDAPSNSMGIYIRDYTIIKNEAKIYEKHDIKKWGNINYLLNDGTYCNFEETTLDDVSNWNAPVMFSNAKQIYSAYSIETDASNVRMWININNYNKDIPIEVGYQFTENGMTFYRTNPAHVLKENNLVYVEFNEYDDLGEDNEFKFSFFTDMKENK